MKTILPRFVFILALLFCQSLFAQEHMEDVVYLKNGGVIHGIIIEQVPNVSLKIKTADRNVFVFRIDEIQKITKEEVSVPEKIKMKAPFTKDDMKQSGYFNISEIGFGRIVDHNGAEDFLASNPRDDVNPSGSIETVNGMLINRNISAGFGIGLQGYNQLSIIPLYADVRYYFLKRRITPFVALDGGGSISKPDFDGTDDYNYDYHGKAYFSFAGGVRGSIRRSFAMTCSLGYRQQDIKIRKRNESYYPYTFTGPPALISLRYLVLKFGFMF